MFPIFLSVSDKDVRFAEQIWEKLPSDLCYLYSKNGVEGADMWEEISRNELPNCKIYIALWSKNFLSAKGCLRELFQASELVKEGVIKALIIRLDDTPIVWDIDQRDDDKEAFEALRALLPVRTSRPNISVPDAIDLISRYSDQVLEDEHPQFSRSEIVDRVKALSRKDRFKQYPCIWLGGFPGVGRLTIIKEMNRSFTPNGRPVVIDINEASLPKQILMRIESEALGADYRRLEDLNSDPSFDCPSEVSKAIEKVADTGNYVVLRHQKIIEENADLPEWIDDCIAILTPRNRPYLFLTSQLPVSVDRRVNCTGYMVDDRISTLLEDESVSYTEQLIAFYDSTPERWSEDNVNMISQSAGGNLGFLVTLVKSVSRIQDFSKVQDFINRSLERQAESIAFYVGWAFDQLKEDSIEQKVLLFLNDVSPCDAKDLSHVISDEQPILGVLGKLMELGLVERDIGGLYRLTPFLSGRLSRHIVRPDLVEWRRAIIRDFALRPIEFQAEEHDFIKIESRIQAALWADGGEVPSSIQKFVSASHWFQAGVRLYHAKQREPAYKLLKKAFERRHEFRDGSRIEIIRYFGLSAVRNNKQADVDACISLLMSDHRSHSMGAFLKAFSLEYQRRYFEAAKEYKVALGLDSGKKSRMERIYRPLVRCILKSRNPNFVEAERYALQWTEIRETVFSKKALAELYLQWVYSDGLSSSERSKVRMKYVEAMDALRVHPSVGSAYFEVLSDEADIQGDYRQSVKWLDSAIGVDPRFEVRVERWEKMSKSKIPDLVNLCVKELEDARKNPDYKSNWTIFLGSTYESYIRALKDSGQFTPARANSFSPALDSKQIGLTIAKVSRELQS